MKKPKIGPQNTMQQLTILANVVIVQTFAKILQNGDCSQP